MKHTLHYLADVNGANVLIIATFDMLKRVEKELKIFSGNVYQFGLVAGNGLFSLIKYAINRKNATAGLVADIIASMVELHLLI